MNLILDVILQFEVNYRVDSCICQPKLDCALVKKNKTQPQILVAY